MAQNYVLEKFVISCPAGNLPTQRETILQPRLYGGNVDKCFGAYLMMSTYASQNYVEPDITRIKAATATASRSHFIPNQKANTVSLEKYFRDVKHRRTCLI